MTRMSNCGSPRRAISIAVSGLIATLFCVTLQAGPLEDLLAGRWYEAPGTRLSAVHPSPEPPGNTGPRAVISAWSGGTFDTSRDRLLVWGGGHADYSGNELYAFDLRTLRWERISEPSSNVGGSSDSYVYPDGKPRSFHTHGYLEYVPGTDRFMSFGAVAPYPNSGNGPKVFGFNLGSRAWETNHPAVPNGGGARGSNAVYDSTTGDVWVQTGEDGAQLHRYNPRNKTWTSHSSAGYIKIYSSAAIDTKRHQFVLVGGNNGGQILKWDLNNPNAAPVDLAPLTTGDSALEASRAPGFQYDPVNDTFVGWDGGADIYTLNPANWQWTRRSPGTGNTVVPPDAAANGTYGRFRYVPSLNLFVVVSSNEQNVFFYKFSPGSGVAQPTLTLNADPTSVNAQGSTTLTWTSTLATACTASGGWSGTKPTSGTETIGPLSVATTFTLACSNAAGGNTSRSVSVSIVTATPPPTVDLTATPNSVPANGTSLLAWTSSNATQCSASGAWSGSKQTSGSQSVGPLAATSSYNLSCSGAGGTTARSVTVTVQAAPPPPPPAAPTVSLSANPASISAQQTSQLTWSATNATSCAASSGWSGTKALSGNETVGPLSNTTTFALSCTGAGGTTNRSVTVTVVPGGGGGGGGSDPPTSDGGGGSLDGAALALLLALLILGRTMHRTVLRSLNKAALPSLAAAMSLCGANLAWADADADWLARSTAPGVVMANGFDSGPEVTDWEVPTSGSARGTNVSWQPRGQDPSGVMPASGAGHARFLIRKQDAQGSGNIHLYLADDQRTFGPGDEYWAQYRVYVPRYFRDHVFPGRDGATNPNGWKTSILSYFGSSFQNNEVVIQNSKQRGYIQGYQNWSGNQFTAWSTSVGNTSCGFQPDQVHQPAIDRGANPLSGNNPATGQPWTACEQSRARYGGLTSYLKADHGPPGPPDPLTAAFLWYPDEWLTILQHVRINALDNNTPNLVETYAARPSQQQYTLVARIERPLGDAHGGHNAIWLTPYHTDKCSYTSTTDGCTADPNRQDTFLLFDEVIVSTEFIPPPGATNGPAVTLSANPTSVQSQGSSTLTWTASGAATCTASGGWSGSKDPAGGNETVGPLTSTRTYNLSCASSSGDSTTRSVTVTVAAATPAPTVNLNANPSSIATNGTSTLDWTTSNATACTASGGWSGSKSTMGSQNVGPLTATTSYTLSCTGAGGSGSDSVTVTVTANPPPPPQPTVDLSAAPTSVAVNGTATLSWTSTGATSCTASGAWSGGKGTSGSEPVGPLTTNATYTLTCSGASGTTDATDSVTVTVTPGGGTGGGDTGSSGGGALDWLMLAGLLGGAVRMRRAQQLRN